MNYAFIAYENALRHLKERVDEEYPNLFNHLTEVQTCLQQNIAQEQISPNEKRKALYEDRKRILRELDTFTKRIKQVSFIEFCIEGDVLLSYLTSIHKTVINALEVFGDKRTIWPDQCNYIASNLHNMPALDKYTTTYLSSENQIILSYINECVAQLRKVMNVFSGICQTRRGTSQRKDIQHKLASLEEYLKQVDETMDEIIGMYIDQPDKSPHSEQKPKPSANQEKRSDTNIFLRDRKTSSSLKKKLRKKRSRSQRAMITRNRQETTSTSPASDTRAGVSPGKSESISSIMPDTSVLRDAMSHAYDLNELELLCGDLNVNINDLGEGTLGVKIHRLIEHFRRRNRYEELINKVLEDRSYLRQIFFPQT